MADALIAGTAAAHPDFSLSAQEASTSAQRLDAARILLDAGDDADLLIVAAGRLIEAADLIDPDNGPDGVPEAGVSLAVGLMGEARLIAKAVARLIGTDRPDVAAQITDTLPLIQRATELADPVGVHRA